MSRMDPGRPPGRTKEELHEDAPAPSKGDTVTAQGDTPSPRPRTPNERDESSDSQAADNPGARRMGELAHDALEQGQKDTSKAAELDATYHRTRTDAEHGSK